jgi:CRISPR-associated exonuclease Cas4
VDADDYIPLSALQHYLYCPRQCALIHLEQLWAESRHTAEGRLLHQRADQPGSERRRGVRTVAAMPLAHREFGITGVADIVEFHADDKGERPYPVEYKRGRPKAHRADEVQLCAQALCLEAMLGVPVPEGALYYGKTRRRKVVAIDEVLRQLTIETIAAVRAMLASQRTPPASYDPKRCDHCSLYDLCLPKSLGPQCSARAWLARQL